MQGRKPAGGTEAGREEAGGNRRDEGGWSPRVEAPWTVACFGAVLVTLCLHYKALCEDRTELSLPELITSMETRCRSLGDVFERPVTEPLLHPVPSQFGVAVWVEREPWSLPVHDALDRIEAAIHRGSSNAAAAVSGPRLIQRIVRVTTKRLRDGGRRNGTAALGTAAAAQQLGLGVAQHVSIADLRGEVVMYGISFFCRASSAASNSHVECRFFDAGRAYCTIPENATSAWLSREVPAAVATLMSRWLKLDSFRDVAAVRRWAKEREAHSCTYALRALRQLERSVATHPDMPAPLDVAETVRRLRALIHAGEFIHFARAADDLQFHPLLLPQLYIPWDQALVIHSSILLPMVVVAVLGVRLTVAARRRRRDAAKKQATSNLKSD
ncbi:GPI transamidase component Tta1 [Trypanosoma conorhini]|uniref:GPI transamidase component Tta1 n=1 Tax=Trypanosoma conorhini TaxID=83891 RepID=A0A422Q7C9_9TRYP|nr:GPI transamidase component Tta1 [Trypanosoma conorhini]RNF25863.1 GPI transamidase component Tta1 [Trypanosoma conorhini]